MSDLVAFQHDFTLEGKSVVTEEENGDLIIEGFAASFEGLDREGENFVPGAFERGIKSFLGRQASLCFHHKHDQGIGKVLDLQERPEGLWMKARVDFQPDSSPLRYIYNAVKKGTYNGLSVGGFFKRTLNKGRRMIADMDFTEISVTPVPVHPGTKFAVVAGKALADDLKIPDGVVKPDLPEDKIRDQDFFALQEALNMLGEVISKLGKRTTSDTSEVVSQ